MQLAALAAVAFRVIDNRYRAALSVIIAAKVWYFIVWHTWVAWLISGYVVQGVLLLMAAWTLREHKFSQAPALAGCVIMFGAAMASIPGWINNYQLARLGIYICVWFGLLAIAKQTYDKYAVGFTAYAAAMLVSTVIKFSIPQWNRVTASHIDPVIFLGMVGIWLLGTIEYDGG